MSPPTVPRPLLRDFTANVVDSRGTTRSVTIRARSAEAARQALLDLGYRKVNWVA